MQPRSIGLLGGLSPEPSILYERILDTEVRRALRGVHSTSLLLRSYDFAPSSDSRRHDEQARQTTPDTTLAPGGRRTRG
jgi:aspartate/glutamate racemase